MSGLRRIGAAIGLLASLGIPAAPSRAELPIEREPIRYADSKPTDPIARLQARIDAGSERLAFDEEGTGYLASVLRALGVSKTSQTLVFSKTSFQHTRIAPRTPRAVYFSDDVYVGWCQGGDVVEVAAVDPKLGATFYILDQEKVRKPRFQRQTDLCIQCHMSSKTKDVPGHLVRSIYPDRRGYPIFSAGGHVTDATSPLKERWGGWYVTGQHGDQRHMGNAILEDADHPENLDVESGANLDDLKRKVDTTPYLAGTSDIVALMVMEHQTQAHNVITAAGYDARMADLYDKGINEALGRPAGTVSDSTKSRIRSHAENIVQAFLFCNEAKLTAPITGNSGFVEQFAERGTRDKQGRSLRDFDLKTRLFRYPCSYLIESEAYRSLPQPVRDRVALRLREILEDRDHTEPFAHLSTQDRRNILQILEETNPDILK